jgi:hypothetical protein
VVTGGRLALPHACNGKPCQGHLGYLYYYTTSESKDNKDVKNLNAFAFDELGKDLDGSKI